MAIETIVASAVSLLAPYVAAGGKKAAEVMGEALAKQAGNLLERVRSWFSDDAEAAATLAKFESDPAQYPSDIAELLWAKSKADPAKLDELQRLLEPMGPRIEAEINISTLAGDAVGLKLKNWQKGVARTKLDVGTVERGATLTGASYEG